LSITGNLAQAASCFINIELGGTAPTAYDRVAVFPGFGGGGTATLAGALNVQLANGFVPVVGNVFTAMTFTARSGVFTSNNAISLGLTTLYTATNVLLIASNAIPFVTFSAPQTQMVCVPFFLVATASDLDGYITNVDFLLGTNLLASLTNRPYLLRFSYDVPGPTAFSARAFDNQCATRTTNLNTTFVIPPLSNYLVGGMQTNGAFKICMVAQTGSDYSVLAITNLGTTNWANLGVMEATNGIWRYTDLAATNFLYRFYRARQLP